MVRDFSACAGYRARIGHRRESESAQLEVSVDLKAAAVGDRAGMLRTGAELAVFHPEEERDGREDDH